jgi:serine/threonine-protein kinase HipA
MDKIDVIEVYHHNSKVGRIALTEQGLCAFEYDTEFLRTGFSLSPYHLPLRTGVFIASRAPFGGNFGVFDDSLPDGWGRLLFDRYLHSKGFASDKLSVLQRFALTGTAGRGALEYFPDKSMSNENEFVNIGKLATDAEKILTTEYTGEGLDTLYKYAGSSGGARPKVFVTIDNRQWLIKFRATNDPQNIGKIEYEYSLLARECGIEMPETRLFEDRYFGVERFDRSENGKIHTVSAAGLLHADYRIPSLDYSVLLKVCLNLTKNMEEVYSLFRLMIFNIVISNRDDHARNFSFQYKNVTWKLSPAYDILPSAGFNGYHTTTVNAQGEPKIQDVMQIAADVGLSEKRIKKIMEQIIETCRKRNTLNYSL